MLPDRAAGASRVRTTVTVLIVRPVQAGIQGSLTLLAFMPVVKGAGPRPCTRADGCALAAAGQGADGCSSGGPDTNSLRGSHMTLMPQSGLRSSLLYPLRLNGRLPRMALTDRSLACGRNSGN